MPRRDRSFVVYVWSKGTHSCVPQRLPTTVRTTEGLLLSGQTGAHHWHEARATIGSFDPLAPFDQSAHRDRTLKLAAIQAKDKQSQWDTEGYSACAN